VADHEAISKLLFEEFGHTLPWSSVKPFRHATVSSGKGLLWFYPVDNTLGDQDGVVRELMRTVERVLDEEAYIHRQVPLAWKAAFDRLRAIQRTSITWPELRQIALECGMPTGSALGLEEEMGVLARFLTALGVLMHHPEPALADIVITNPVDFLAIPASIIVCDHTIHHLPQHEEAKGKYPVLWKEMLGGVVDARLLAVLWKESAAHLKHLEALLVKFGVLVPLLDSNAQPDTVRYLVPALLRQREPPAAQHAQPPVLTCFLLFATSDVMAQWRRTGNTTLAEAGKEGFLPGSLFPRLLAKCARRQQIATKGDEIDPSALSKEWGALRYGMHEFVITHLPQECCMRLDVLVDSSYVVQEVLEQAREVLREVMSCLQVSVFVPSDGGHHDQPGALFKYHAYTGQLVLLDSKTGVETRVEGGRSMRVEGRLLDAVQLRALFHWFLPGKGELDVYHVFLSYRWGLLDSVIAKAIFTRLSQEVVGRTKVAAFLDVERLENGCGLQRSFGKALVHSWLAAPIVSHHALAKMRTLTPEHEDNVVLEWMVMQELVERAGSGAGSAGSLLKRCLPILMGAPLDAPAPNGAMVGNFFAGDPVASLPAIALPKVAATAAEILGREVPAQPPSPQLAQTTVRDMVGWMTKQLAVTAWDSDASHGGSAGERTPEHQEDEFKRLLVDKATAEILECLQKIHSASASAPPPAAAPSPSAAPGLDALDRLLEGLNLGESVARARAWCDENGVESIADLLEAEMEEDLAAGLELKPAKAKILVKRLKDK